LPKQVDTSEEGLERLRAAVQANPRSTTFVALAHRLCEAGRAAEAEDVCREGLGRHPGLVTGQVALGRALLDRGRLREAQEVLIAAAKANPDHGDAFRWLGEVVIKKDDLPRARALLEYAEELSPNDRRVTELLIEAGGTPTFRSPRPKTDFEHTRVSNARALADRMHEDPTDEPTRVGPELTELLAAETSDGQRSAGGLGIDEPTVVDGRAALQAWRDAGAVREPSSPFSSESEKIQVPQVGELEVAARPHEPSGARLPLVQVVDNLVDQDRTPVSRMPVPGRQTLSAMRVVGKPVDRKKVLLVGGLAAGLALAGLIAFLATRPNTAVVQGLRGKMAAAISAGTLRSLGTARELGKQILSGAPGDGETLAGLAYVQALLLRDYGVGERKQVEAELAAARAVKGSPAARVGTLEATGALLALSAGRLAEAQQCAEKAVAATPDGAPALLAAARVKMHNADLEGARRDLERLLQRTPEYAEAVLDWAAIWIDAGDPSTASQSLRDQIKRTGDHLRARLLLAEAERALGERSAGEGLEAACRSESRESPSLRVGCLLAASSQSRLAGDHQAAVRSARAAAAEIPPEPRLLATAALGLAVLGEIDVADEALRRAKGLARETAVPLVWADAAVRLGRRQVVVPSRILDSAAGPERRLVAARLILAYEGAGGLAKQLKTVPRGLVLIDPDLHALSQLAEEGAARADRTDLEKRAEHGDPVAAYVLGRMLERGSPSAAWRRLEKALWGHGDVCEAAVLLRNILRQQELGPPSIRIIRELRSRNAQCPAAQL
jgi:tetratricopeptide (TPR) repeat protein